MDGMNHAEIFEFMENRYDELVAIDGGYHPLKHDPIVNEEASKKFSVPGSQIQEIYSNFKEALAKREMAQINKLPPAQRKAAMMERMKEIIYQNADAPFAANEGVVPPPIRSGSEEFLTVYLPLVEKLAEDGWTIPLFLKPTQFEELIACQTSEEVDGFFLSFYTSNIISRTQKHISQKLTNPAHKTTFTECIKAFDNSMFSICALALLTVTEGVISQCGDDPTDVRIMRICNFNAEDESKKGKHIRSLAWKSMYRYTKVLFEKSDFSQPEPQRVNRHWALHGRSGQEIQKIDCLRLFNGLSTLTLISNYQ